MNNYQLAQNLNTSAELLDEVVKDDDIITLLMVANHVNTSSATLDKLSHNKDTGLRMLIAQNHNTSPETLERLLFGNIDLFICRCLYGNPNTPNHIKCYTLYLNYLNLLPQDLNWL